MLRPGRGHGHLHLWTHVSVPRVWAEAQETDERLLPYLPQAHQRCHQDVSALIMQYDLNLFLPHGGMVDALMLQASLSPVCFSGFEDLKIQT